MSSKVIVLFFVVVVVFRLYQFNKSGEMDKSWKVKLCSPHFVSVLS